MEELTHHGIRGMRWGVRRYQNKDGSLTALGKRKYGTKENFENAMADKKHNKAKKKSGSDISKLSDEELKAKNARLTLEEEYYRHKRNINTYNPPKKSKAKEFINNFAKNAIVPAINEAGKKYLGKFLDKSLSSTFETINAKAKKEDSEPKEKKEKIKIKKEKPDKEEKKKRTTEEHERIIIMPKLYDEPASSATYSDSSINYVNQLSDVPIAGLLPAPI